MLKLQKYFIEFHDKGTMGTSMILCFTWSKAYDISPICQEKRE